VAWFKAVERNGARLAMMIERFAKRMPLLPQYPACGSNMIPLFCLVRQPRGTDTSSCPAPLCMFRRPATIRQQVFRMDASVEQNLPHIE
jgi:hypothetical protein